MVGVVSGLVWRGSRMSRGTAGKGTNESKVKERWKPADTIAIVFAVLAVLSAGLVALTASRYLRGMSAASGFRVCLSNLQLTEESGTEAVVTFRLKNASSISVRLEDFHFSLYLNGSFVGSCPGVFAERRLGGFEEAEMDVIVGVLPFYARYIEQARQKDRFAWSVRGEAKLVLPFGGEVIWLSVREHWS